jgi:proteasome accessory factor C
MTGERERLPRLLALVPYLQAHQGVSTAEAAADFAISEEQLRRDLQLLWMCGLPGHGPGDLIDLSFEGDTVSVLFDAGMSRPLRLSTEEALTLAIGLRALVEIPGVTDRDAIQRALAKVEAAAGGSLAGATAVSVELDPTAKLEPVLRSALERQRALALRYYTATRDEISGRAKLPRSLVPQRRRGAHFPARPHRAGRGARRAVEPTTGHRAAGSVRRALHAGPGTPARHPAYRAGLRVGRRLLPQR